MLQKGGWGEGTKWKEVPCIRLERKLLMRHYGFAKGSPRFTADRQDPTFDNVTNWSLTIDQAPDHADILRIQTTLLYLCQLYWKDEEPPASGGQSAQWHLRARQSPSQCSWQRWCIVCVCIVALVLVLVLVLVYCSAGVRGPGASGCETDKAKSLPDAHTPLACNLDNGGRDVSRHPRGVGLVVIIISFVFLLISGKCKYKFKYRQNPRARGSYTK